jgi:hypothetical protein
MAVFGRLPSWSDVYLGKNQLTLTVPDIGIGALTVRFPAGRFPPGVDCITYMMRLALEPCTKAAQWLLPRLTW